MATIKIVSNLKLHPKKGLLAKDSSGKWVKVHYQQGELDGACAVYSVVMNLLILSMIKEEDICLYNPIDKRKRTGKILAHLLENNGLVRDGYYFKTLAKKLRDYSNIDAKHKRRIGIEETISFIHSNIYKDTPIIFSVSGTDWAHAILVIGIEYNDKNIPSKFLCLDPSAPSPIYAHWNCIVDISTPTIWYKTECNQDKVEIRDMMLISNE